MGKSSHLHKVMNIRQETVLVSWMRNSIILLSLALVLSKYDPSKPILTILGRVLIAVSIFILGWKLYTLKKIKYNNKQEKNTFYFIKIVLLVVNIIVFITI